jgi:phenylalanine-4-hydroxylase
MSDAHLMPQSVPAGAAADWTIPQRWDEYTRVEHATWNLLLERQRAALPDRVAPAFLDGLKALHLDAEGIPDFQRLSDRLQRRTGWSVVAVPGLVPTEVFFDHLANRRFVAGRFIRTPAQLDYLQEPDIFHDVFGHVPLLAHPVYADYMEAYGRGGLRAVQLGALQELARLYWYTVEFGLVRDGDQLRLFGAGIVSSASESHYALHDPTPLRIGFDLRRVMRTDYAIDTFQRNYFVIESFEDLLRQTVETDFEPIYREVAALPTLAIGAMQPQDRFFPANPGRAPA